MKFLSIINLFLLITYSIVFLLKIWYSNFDSQFFIKITITYLLVFTVSNVINYYFYYNNCNEEKLKKDKYID